MTRLISYYICFILCGAVTLSYHASLIRRNYKPIYVKELAEEEEETPDDEAYRLVHKEQMRLPDSIDILRAQGEKEKEPEKIKEDGGVS